MTTDLPAIPVGPIDRKPSGSATTSEREELLRQVLADAGVELGADDERIVTWFADCVDWSTFAVIASWVRRAARE